MQREHHMFQGRVRRGGIGGGIGLVMVLVVMLIILALYFGTFGGKSYMQNVAATRKSAIQTAQDITTNQLMQCIVAYRVGHDRLPKDMAELDLSVGETFDPWHHPISFTYGASKEGAPGETWVIWHSDGPDGQAGTADDIVKKEKLPI